MAAVLCSALVLVLIVLCWKKDMPIETRVGLMICAAVAFMIIVIRLVQR